MSKLTSTVAVAAGILSDPDVRHPRVRSEDEAAREFPQPRRPLRLVHKHRGQRFRPHGTDSIGVIKSHPSARKTVQFSYEHDRDKLHSMPAHEFTDRFAALIGVPARSAPAAAGVRHVRPTEPGILQAIKKAA